jgi:hypothetical protein
VLTELCWTPPGGGGRLCACVWRGGDVWFSCVAVTCCTADCLSDYATVGGQLTCYAVMMSQYTQPRTQAALGGQHTQFDS